MFDADSNKDYCKDDYTKERNCRKEETCVEINIFCEDEIRKAKYDYYNGNYKKDYKDEKTCVVINIFCEDEKKKA